MTKKTNNKRIKPEIIIVAAVFGLVSVYVLSLAGKNIASVSSIEKGSTPKADGNNQVKPQNPKPASTQVTEQVQPQVVQQEPLKENPVKKVRAIVNNSALINDDNRWYQVGDMVEGQAKILAIEPTRVLVEWNGTQSYVPIDLTVVQAPQTPPQQAGGQFNNLTDEQRQQIAQGLQQLGQSLQGLQSLGQIWQNTSPEEQQAMQNRMQEMVQRVQNMPQDQRQNAVQQLGQQWQQWLQTDQSQIPNFTIP
jgi:hypothetical protein